MKQLFLGKWWHWAILALAVLLMWLAGQQKMHVIHFNLFVGLLFFGTLAGVVWIVLGTGSDEQVTRDPIQDDS